MSSTVLQQFRDTFVTQNEAASLLGVSRRTLWLWVKKGKVRSERLWGVVLIEKSEVERLKAGR